MPNSGVPPQEEIRLNGHALQCRITTEDPEQNFIPDYGRITAYRGATGFGIRLDGGTAYSGAVITRFYDPLLEKVTAWAPSPEEAIARMDRALREFRIRGVATNLAFLENVIAHPRFRDVTYTTRFIDETPELIGGGQAPRPRDEASDLHRRRDGERPSGDARPAEARSACAEAGRAGLRGPTGRRHEAAPRPRRRRRHSPRGCAPRSACSSPTRPCATRTSRCSRRACARTTSSRSRRPTRRRCPSFCRSNAGAARPSTSPCAS